VQVIIRHPKRRQKVHNNGVFPNFKNTDIGRTSLHKLIKSIVYSKDSKQRGLCEKPHIVRMRVNFVFVANTGESSSEFDSDDD
jgi:hypothetical protein